MSEETVLRFKIATLVTIGMGILSIGITIVSIWVANISSCTANNSIEIAILKEGAKNLHSTSLRIETVVEEIRRDQLKRERKEQK